LSRWKVATVLCLPALFVFSLTCGGCGSDPEPAEERTATQTALATKNEEWFHDLRPNAGDVLVPPRIGLRWEYVPSNGMGGLPYEADSTAADALLGGSSVPDSARRAAPAGTFFRVHVVDSLDVPYVEHETRETDIRVTLPPETPPGTYSWWIESFLEGGTDAVAVSARETFRIE
jgi:hypothetical protein